MSGLEKRTEFLIQSEMKKTKSLLEKPFDF
jgi:hypothetical protein